MNIVRRHPAVLIVVAVLATAGVVAAVVAAPGGVPGKPGGSGEDTAVNNLSFPVIFAETEDGKIPAGADMGEAILDGEFVVLDDLSLAFLQKDPENLWQANWAENAVTVSVDYMDVSDNLEAVPWRTTSVVRVEFVPFGVTTDLTGFEMAYVSGQGIDEVWGLHAVPEFNGEGDIVAISPIPDLRGYATLFSKTMGMSLTKLESDAGSIDVPPDPYGYIWDRMTQEWEDVAQTDKVEPMTAEINVKGRVIYGYNWMLKRTVMTPGVLKEGWWRLTFYSLQSPSPLDLTTDTLMFDPTNPPVPETEAEPEPGSYPRVPVIDDDADITYIDVYIQAKTTGGGGGKGGNSGGGGGGGKGNTK